MFKDIITAIGVILLASAILLIGTVILGRSRTGEPSNAKVAPAHLFGDYDCETSGCTYVQNGEIVKLFDGIVECRMIGAEGWYKTSTCFFQSVFAGNCTFIRCNPRTTAEGDGDKKK
jgi:hypothetical protein